MTDKKIEEWNDFLKKQYNMPDNFKLVNTNTSTGDSIWKIAAILLGVVFVLEMAGIGGYFGYLGYTGKLNPDISVNTTNNIDTPDIPITNEYEHKIYNNITVNVEIPEELNLVIKNESG